MIGFLGPAAWQSAAKYIIPAALIFSLSDLGLQVSDVINAGAILIGLAGGAMVRASFFAKHVDALRRIRADLLVSGMSAIANFIIASVIVGSSDFLLTAWAGKDIPTEVAAGVGTIVGFMGNDNVGWFAKKLLGIEIKSDDVTRADFPAVDNTPAGMLDAATKLESRLSEDPDKQG